MTSKEALKLVKALLFPYYQGGIYKLQIEAIKRDLDNYEKLKRIINKNIK